MENARFDKATPRIIVVNNTGSIVRQLAYYRREAETAAEVRVTLQRYNDIGQLTRLIDPRLSQYYLHASDSTIPNQSQINTLGGAVLQSKNVDAGLRIRISDVRGLALWTNDSLGNEQVVEYDQLSRMTSRHEKIQGKKVVCSDRFVYGDNSAKAINGIGRLLKCYDSAGLSEVKSYSALGNILSESRQFLEKMETIDWPESLAESQQVLEKENYTTQWKYNGLGEVIHQTDAKGNTHNVQYGIAGEILSSGLQLKAGTEQAIITKQTYNAAGQLLEKHLANGVVIQYRYEEKTQRLSRLHSVRLSDSQSLQDLNYRYDPVGNVLETIDKAKEPGFYANEKTEAVSQYRYDSLYQLIEAKGIESQQAAKESTVRNPALRLGNADASRCVNYTRNYTYDTGGNLYEIQHHGAQRYTRNLQIAADSNRGIEKRDSGPGLVESFDANGNLLYLNTEKPLQWDSRNQLQQVVQLKRETHSDAEVYRYEASGQRVEKLTQQLAKDQIHNNRVRYLPGLELRERWQTDVQGRNKKVTEQLHIIQSDSVRVLHWETGKPNDIENDGLRYSLTDQLGYTQLELNAKGEIISYESYYPYGGTAILATKNAIETHYKFIRYSGKEQDATGLYYYGYRYYLPWLGRWLNPDPSGIADGLNLFCMVHNNPITFYDNDGRRPTAFKKLYPETEQESETGRSYRVIKRIYGFKDRSKEKQVNVRAFEVGVKANAKAAYLFTGPTKAKQLIVDAHAFFYPQLPPDLIHLESGMPTISLLGPHGEVLKSSLGLLLVDKIGTYAKISSEGITLTSRQAKEVFDKETSYKKITGAEVSSAIHNYFLRKFRGDFTSDTVKTHYFERLAELLSLSRKGEESQFFDVLTIRRSRAGSRITVADILVLAQQEGYEEVVLNFCRSPLSLALGEEWQKFRVRTIRPLRVPVFKTWSEMGNLKRSNTTDFPPQKRQRRL